MKVEVDYWLVPIGFGILLAYHFWLLKRIIRQPMKTVIGIHAINQRHWVHTMMEDEAKSVLAVQTLRNNIMSSSFFASTAIMLSSVIVVLLGNGRTGEEGGVGLFSFFVGDKSPLGYSIKFFSILICFLFAFLCTMQTVRCYNHVTFLVNVPIKKRQVGSIPTCLTKEYVADLYSRGGYFCSLGLRAFYFAFSLFLWIFGPVPMFVSCIFMVLLLYFLDTTSEFSGREDDKAVYNHEDIEQV